MAKSRNLLSSIVLVTAPATADTEFAVAHGLPAAPRGAFVVRRTSPSARLYRSATFAGVGAGTNFIAGWEFENAASLGEDSGPNGLTLTNVAGVTQTATAVVGQAGNFVLASTQYLTRNSEALLQLGDIDFTFCAWCRAASLAANMIVAAKRNGVVADSEFQTAYLLASNRFFTQVYTGAGAVTLTDTVLGAPSINTWYFLVWWHDATANTLNLQINNGAVQSTPTGAALQAASGAPFRIGGRGDASILPWDGQLDQVMFWKRTLTTTERTALYNAGAGVTVTEVLEDSVSTDVPWDSTNAYLKSSVSNVQYYVMFFV